jgi:cytochrome c oxidase subunit 2
VAGAGAALPTVVLAGTLAYGLALLPPLLPSSGNEGTRTIEVVGEHWWWRVRCRGPDGAPVELANEIRLPVGEPVLLELTSDDVIHSFWIPALGGKADMIPGRQIRLLLEPTAAGVYRGVCAEYCGASHALMSLFVVVEPEDEFQRWLAKQAQPAPAPRVRTAAQGEELLIASGCGACHSVRGTPADGVLGPGLTHVGSRQSIGAGALPLDSGALLRWISRTNDIKPSVHMPAFGMLPPDDLQALAVYLEGLK